VSRVSQIELTLGAQLTFYSHSTDMLLNRPPLAALSGYEESKRLRRKDQAQFIVNHPSYDKVFWLIGQSNPIRRACQYIVTPSAGDRIFGARPRRRARFVFRIILIATVIASLIMAIIATPLYRKSYFEKHGIQRATWFNLAELALMVIFLAEFLIKVLADGFLFCPNVSAVLIWTVTHC
jgi:voltage-dependent calcium channel